MSPTNNNNNVSNTNKNKVGLIKANFDLRDVKLVMLEALEEIEKLTSMEEAISGLTKLSSSLRVEVIEQRNKIAQVEKNVVRLDMKVKAVMDGRLKAPAGDSVLQDCLEELSERQLRKGNLIIHGLAEAWRRNAAKSFFC